MHAELHSLTGAGGGSDAATDITMRWIPHSSSPSCCNSASSAIVHVPASTPKTSDRLPSPIEVCNIELPWVCIASAFNKGGAGSTTEGVIDSFACIIWIILLATCAIPIQLSLSGIWQNCNMDFRMHRESCKYFWHETLHWGSLLSAYGTPAGTLELITSTVCVWTCAYVVGWKRLV